MFTHDLRIRHCSARLLICVEPICADTHISCLPHAAYLTRERLDKAKKLQLIINLSEGAGFDMT